MRSDLENPATDTESGSPPDEESSPVEEASHASHASPASPLRAAVRGLVASMAMTGMREVTTGMGWLERTPPEEILEDEAPLLVLPLSEGHERVAVQLAHWAYGTAGGAAYGLLPASIRRSRLAGPGYGLAIWLGYELVIAPALGVQVARRRSIMSRLMLVADHLLYGLVVADQVAPEATDATKAAQ